MASNIYASTGGKPVEGAWYGNQRYLGGKLLAPNEYEPGKQVSDEVNKQSAAAQGKSWEEFNSFVKGPASSDQVTPFLNSFQNGLFSNMNNPETRVQSLGEISSELRNAGILPTGEAPKAPSLLETYKSEREASGVAAIEADISTLKAQQDEIAAGLRINTAAERGKPVAKNVIEGRISEQERTAREDYDFISRQLARKIDEHTSVMGNIKLIMDFTQQDYTNASNQYNTEFERAITTFNLIRGIQNDQKTEAQRAQDNARANLQIMVNAITSGNLSLNGIGPEQQAQLNKLEVQSGLPVGFMSALQMSPKDRIISTSSDNGVISVLSVGANGQPTLQKYGTPNGPGNYKVGSAEYVAASKNNIIQGLSAAKNKSGHVSPQVWNQALTAWISDVGTKDQFVSNFSNLADYNRGDFEKAYGFSLE